MTNDLTDEEKRQINSILIHIISETNGLSLNNTLELLTLSPYIKGKTKIHRVVSDFVSTLKEFQHNSIPIDSLIDHPLAQSLFYFFKNFPISYHEEHIHLTGSLDADFIWSKIKVLLNQNDGHIYLKKINAIYNTNIKSLSGVDDVLNLIQLKQGEEFKRYLQILFLPKLILRNQKDHEDAAYHMATKLYAQYNVGNIRLKFTLSRSTGIEEEKIPGQSTVSEEDTILGLYKGFIRFKKENPLFNFVLSPSFRKEKEFYDIENFPSKKDHFDHQVKLLLSLLEKYPELREYLLEIDTVGDEKNLYRKAHFEEMKDGLRKLQYHGIKIRSHHGETWKILRKGVQSVDNAMNIWHIDTLEHGLSLGINPNFYFHRIFQQSIALNDINKPILPNTQINEELEDFNWINQNIKFKLQKGERLSPEERIEFIKTKFHNAREIEHYQHDILNRMINKGVSLVALPSSNLKLTGCFPDYKDHPFSWWEKKGVQLGIGTDNYITLNTNYIKEMMILLFSEPENLKITKLLMVATKEKRRAYISHLLWKMRKSNPL